MTDEELITRLRTMSTNINGWGHGAIAADRIEQLVATNEALVKRLETAVDVVAESGRRRWRAEVRAEQLAATNKRLEAAMRFYARRGVVSPWVDDEINEDGGDIARAALKGADHE